MSESKNAACSLENDVPENIVLISADDIPFPINRKCALMSKLVFQALDAGKKIFFLLFRWYFYFLDVSALQVNIPGAKGEIIALVTEYMIHHAGVEPPIIEKPLRSSLMKNVCKDAFDSDFIDKIGTNRKQLYDLILAANYLDCMSLLHLVNCCYCVFF